MHSFEFIIRENKLYKETSLMIIDQQEHLYTDEIHAVLKINYSELEQHFEYIKNKFGTQKEFWGFLFKDLELARKAKEYLEAVFTAYILREGSL